MGKHAKRTTPAPSKPAAPPSTPAPGGGWDVNERPSTGRIHTFTGRMVSPFDLRASDLDLRDIAHSLAQQCRYAGHTSRHYSVAEHCYHVSRLSEHFARERLSPGVTRAPEVVRFARWGLMHDGGEAYLPDTVRPLKMLPQFAFLREFDDRNTATIGTWLGIGEKVPELVDEIDKNICVAEKLQLFSLIHPDWRSDPRRPTYDLGPIGLPAQVAEELFLERFAELWPARR